MKKINIISILGFLVITIALIIIKLIPTEAEYKTIKISNFTLKVELADTQLKRIEGLMSKKILPNNEGMLFIFNEENHHKIWMMNMSFPIDIIWINKNLKIVHIIENAQPCKINCPVYLPDEKALYVLEVNSGFVKKNKLQTGYSVTIV